MNGLSACECVRDGSHTVGGVHKKAVVADGADTAMMSDANT